MLVLFVVSGTVGFVAGYVWGYMTVYARRRGVPAPKEVSRG